MGEPPGYAASSEVYKILGFATGEACLILWLELAIRFPGYLIPRVSESMVLRLLNSRLKQRDKEVAFLIKHNTGPWALFLVHSFPIN